MMLSVVSEIKDDLFFYDEDGAKIVYTAAVAHVRFVGSDGSAGNTVFTKVVQVPNPDMLRHKKFSDRMKHIAEEGAVRMANESRRS